MAYTVTYYSGTTSYEGTIPSSQTSTGTLNQIGNLKTTTLKKVADGGARNYTITIDPANGSSTYTKTTSGGTYTNKYSFDYWYCSSSNISPRNSNYQYTAGSGPYYLTGNVSMTARYKSTYTQQYTGNAQVTLPSAPSRSGYTFNGWKDSYTGTVHDAGDTVKSIAANRTFTAQWKAIPVYTYKGQISGPSGSATINPTSGSRTGPGNVTFTVSLKGVQYYVKGWSLNGNAISGTDGALSVSVYINSNSTVTCVIGEKKSYTINVSAGTGGSVSPSGDRAVLEGGSLEMTATANALYDFSYWGYNIGANGYTSTKNPITAVNVNEDRNYHAYFKSQKVTVNASGNGYIVNKNTGESGDSVSGYRTHTFQFIATGATGHHFTSVDFGDGDSGTWSGCEHKYSTGGTYTATFNYDRNQYHLYVEAGKGEYLQLKGAGDYYYGTTFSVDATLDPHYEWETWKDSDGNFYGAKQNGGRMPAHDLTMYAYAHPVAYYARANVVGNGKVEGQGEYNYKDTVKLKAVPDTGWAFQSWEDGSTNPEREFVMREPITVTATFYRVSFVLMGYSSPEQGGSITNLGQYNAGTKVTIEAVPNDAYRFTGWENGSTSKRRTITVNEDTYVYAYFELKQYSVATNAYPDHAGYVDGGDIYTHGDRATLTAYPIELHEFLNWDNGSGNNPYRFNVYGDTFLTAIFGRDPNIFVGDMRIKDIRLGDTPLNKVCLGDTKLYLY